MMTSLINRVQQSQPVQNAVASIQAQKQAVQSNFTLANAKAGAGALAQTLLGGNSPTASAVTVANNTPPTTGATLSALGHRHALTGFVASAARATATNTAKSFNRTA